MPPKTEAPAAQVLRARPSLLSAEIDPSQREPLDLLLVNIGITNGAVESISQDGGVLVDDLSLIQLVALEPVAFQEFSAELDHDPVIVIEIGVLDMNAVAFGEREILDDDTTLAHRYRPQMAWIFLIQMLGDILGGVYVAQEIAFSLRDQKRQGQSSENLQCIQRL